MYSLCQEELVQLFVGIFSCELFFSIHLVNLFYCSNNSGIFILVHLKFNQFSFNIYVCEYIFCKESNLNNF